MKRIIHGRLSSVAFIAGAMRGFSGFGGGLLIAPVYSMVLTPTDVVVIVLVLNLLTTIQLLPEIHKVVHWPTVLSLLLPACFGIPVGVFFLHSVDPVIMRRMIAFLVLTVAILMLLGWTYKGKHGRLQDTIAGLLSGFLTSIGGVGGPPIILYLLSNKNIDGAVFRAIVLMLFFLMQIVAISQVAFSGAVQSYQMVYVAVLLPLYGLAHWTGARCFRRWGKHQKNFHRIALWFLLFIGIVAFLM